MSSTQVIKNPKNLVPAISTAEILNNAPLPAAYLNQFSSEAPAGEIGLRSDAIRANEQIIPVTNQLQVFALNCLAIGVEMPVSSGQLVALGEGSRRGISKHRLTRHLLPFVEEFNQAADEELIRVTKGASRTYLLQPVRFVQDKEPHNELFERLTETGRRKFGTRVLRLIYGNIDRLIPSNMRPAEPVGDDLDTSHWCLRSACRGKNVEFILSR